MRFIFKRIKNYIPLSIKQGIKNNWCNFVDKINIFFVTILGVITSKFITFHARPKFLAGVNIYDDQSNYDCSEYAIIIQGPIITKNRFTLETLLLYKKCFRNALLILSTWEDEDADAINLIKKAGIKVLLNKKPDHNGPVNINMQIVSSKSGIEYASRCNKKYLLKTRTDTRIYNRESLFFLSNLLKSFPLVDQGAQQKGRLIGININGARRKLYHFPDLFVFGYLNDLAIYFSASLINKQEEALMATNLGAPFTAERYLLTEFLRKINYPIKNTYEDSMRVLVRNCMIIDSESLRWYWYKYKYFLEFRSVKYNDRNYSVGFTEWLNLYYLNK